MEVLGDLAYLMDGQKIIGLQEIIRIVDTQTFSMTVMVIVCLLWFFVLLFEYFLLEQSIIDKAVPITICMIVSVFAGAFL